MRKYLTTIAAALVSCASYDPQMPEVLQDELEAMYEEAVDKWLDATGLEPEPVRLHAVRDYIDCSSKITVGCFNYRTRDMWVHVDRDPELVRLVVLHEVGHALGVVRHLPAGNVMAAEGHLPEFPTKFDANAVLQNKEEHNDD